MVFGLDLSKTHYGLFFSKDNKFFYIYAAVTNVLRSLEDRKGFEIKINKEVDTDRFLFRDIIIYVNQHENKIFFDRIRTNLLLRNLIYNLRENSDDFGKEIFVIFEGYAFFGNNIVDLVYITERLKYFLVGFPNINIVVVPTSRWKKTVFGAAKLDYKEFDFSGYEGLNYILKNVILSFKKKKDLIDSYGLYFFGEKMIKK